MPKKKRVKESTESFPPLSSSSAALDPAALATVLSAEYPLLDSSLVHAIVLDHDPSALNNNLAEIRAQLGILEATSVPDPDDERRLTPAQSDERYGSAITSDPSERSRPISPAFNSALSSSTAATENTEADDVSSPQSEAELLAVFFPKLLAKDIASALAAEPSLEAAIDHLLSVELIRGVQRSGQWPGEEDAPDEGEWKVQSRRGSASRRGSSSSGTPPTLPKSRRGSVTTYSAIPLPPTSAPPSVRGTKGKGKKQRPTLTIPVVDTLQRRAPSRPATPATPASASSAPVSDVWAAFSSLAAFLGDTVPRGQEAFFLSFLHSPDYMCAHEAVLAALGSLAQTSRVDPPRQAVEILEAMYDTTLEDDETLSVCIRATDGDVAATMDLMATIEELTWWPDYEAARANERDPFEMLAGLGDSLPGSRAPSRAVSRAGSRPPSRAGSRPAALAVPPVPPLPAILAPVPTRAANGNRLTRPTPAKSAKREAKSIPGAQASTSSYRAVHHSALPASTAPAVLPARKQGHVNWKTVAPKSRPTKHPYSANIPAYAHASGPPTSVRDCYDRGEVEWQRRAEAIRAAGRHFTAGGRKDLAAQVAGHYAAQAREAAEAAKTWELTGARMVVDAQLSASGDGRVDLHYATVEQAVALAKEAAERWWSQGRGGGRELQIVTGKGLHSAGKGVLGPSVAKALAEEGWRVERREGSVAVKGR